MSFTVKENETVAIVGESGSGKSVTGLSIMRLLPSPPAHFPSGRIVWRAPGGEVDLLTLPEKQMRAVRGNQIAMIFQEPMTSLNPLRTIGNQIAEALKLHENLSKSKANERAIDLIRGVGISDPESRIKNYPHELSGGMRQRVMIAIALACNPKLLIADEPTTALDVTIQAQILDLIRSLQDRLQMAVLMITHDFGVVSEVADRVIVMYAGQVVEEASWVDTLFGARHPYTLGLLKSVPRLSAADARGKQLESIRGLVPDPTRVPSGCAFHPRCDHALDGVCDRIPPELESCGSSHEVRCHRWREIARPPQ